MKIVDVWGQILSAKMAHADWMQSLLRWTRQDAGSVSKIGADETLAAMDESEVDTMLLAAWYGPQGALISNEDVASKIFDHPKRFRGLASADIRKPGEAVREIRRWVDGERFVGVRIVPWLWELPPDDRRYYPVFAACEEIGVPVCTQIGHTGPLLSSEPGRPIPYLERVLLEFPNLKVVGGHLGFPWVDELTTLAVKFPNFYVDTSAYAAHRFPTDFVEFMHGAGRGRVMFGTNWPMVQPKAALQGLDQLGLDETQTTEFLSGTARRVFNL